jgi:serine/threonine-protein kinase HipA
MAATLTRERDGVHFRYVPEYLEAGRPPVATTLPLESSDLVTVGGAVPAYFAGLLPEGRRLTYVRRAVKASADDELTLLCEVGSDPVGDVQVVPSGASPLRADPAVDIDGDIDFASLLGEGSAGDRVALAGVQDKVSGRMIRVPARLADRRYILKLNPPEFPHVVENEAFFLAVSRACGIPTVESRVLIDRFGNSALLVTRFDRAPSANGPRALAVEDGCQVLDRWPADKYSLSTGQVFGALAGLCAAHLVAARALFRQLCFAIVTGNGDLHAKNVSVVGDESGEWRIAPAYDLPSTAFYGDRTLALAVLGRRSGISRRVLLDFAESIGLRRSGASRWLDGVLDGTADLVARLEEGALPFDESTTRKAIRLLVNNRRLLTEGR